MATTSGETIDDSGAAQPVTDDPDGATPSSTARGLKRRRRLATVLAVLACISIFVSTVAVWSHNTLLNTDAWVETVGPLVDDPAVTDVVAEKLTTEMFTAIRPEQLAQQALPDKAQFLAAPIANAVRSFVLTETKKLLQTQQFKDLWVSMNRIAHENAVKILRGEPVAGFEAQNGTVTVNILPLLAKTMQAIDQKVPRLFGDQPIPDISSSTPPDEARAQLSAVLPVTLPPSFGVYTIFQSDQLAAAQQAVKLFDRLVAVLVILSVALLVAAIWLTPNRRRIIIGLGVGIVLAMALANGVIQAFQNVVLDLITGETTRAAAETTLVQLVSRLRAITNGLLWLGIIVVLVAFITGDTRLAVGIRGAFMRLAGRATHTITDKDNGALPMVRDHAPAFRIGGVVAAVLALVAINVTVAGLLVVLLLLAVYEGFVAVLAGPQARATDDPAEPTDPADATEPTDTAAPAGT